MCTAKTMRSNWKGKKQKQTSTHSIVKKLPVWNNKEFQIGH
jgi:hypothetical protein